MQLPSLASLPSSPVSLWPGLQQLDTAPAHSSGARLGAGHSPTSPSPPAPESPKAPAAASYSPVEAAQSTLNLEISDFRVSADLPALPGLGLSFSFSFIPLLNAGTRATVSHSYLKTINQMREMGAPCQLRTNKAVQCGENVVIITGGKLSSRVVWTMVWCQHDHI